MNRERRSDAGSRVDPALSEVEPSLLDPVDELEEAADLLSQQEPPDVVILRGDPSTPTEYADPALIDPAD